ncbi:deoxyribodipyrimidine photo-lyase [Streptomyces sp. AJS327]|uniref:cryptochrome/photolyase family protein n=1 Tax=Streptomyces sp. AJS327 TaxID=2545265 RepID=UPI0015DE9233|nr:deoxyribodipyrimidine photo-lyase [Streptomyces sp. AJS327]MBA0052953.1 deoxyribodipyrimidine photo-lyase [Streptomyces sp. AJS327]
MSGAVVLFTSDLRTYDHPPLRAALRPSGGWIVPLFVVDEGVRNAGFDVPNRRAFLADCLADLDGSLRAAGGRLVVRTGEVATEVRRVVRETGARAVHLSAGVSGYALRREERLRRALEGTSCAPHVHDAVITALPPGAVTPAGKDHFAVFTPYFRRWEAEGTRSTLGAPRAVRVPEGVRSDRLPGRPGRGVSPGLPQGGEGPARRRLNHWLRYGLDEYADRQDRLDMDGTSRLSPYLHFGCLSPVETVRRATDRGGEGARAFVRQLAWRDFHHQVLAARPGCSHADYRTHHDSWQGDGDDAATWRAGRTGYPLVDAAMRQLAHEGWAHNRARLVAASFLAKTLYVDWRVGARHFLQLLVDGDVANNQLNWQWVAGTGTDTRPNRVLNPVSQARRLDPEGAYVRRWLPELATLPGRAAHEPWRLDERERRQLDYPAPMVALSDGSRRFHQARARGT